MATDITKRIECVYSIMSKTQKRLSMIVIREPGKIVDLTAERFGIMAKTSESTIMRFCRLLGYGGYSDFQAAVQQLVKTRLTPTQRIEITKKRMGAEA